MIDAAQSSITLFYDTDDLSDGEISLRLVRTAPERPERRWLPAYYFEICLADGTKVGTCDLRIGHNEKTYIGGNIGYGVDEAHRGHGYAAKACRLMFMQARKHGMDHLYITCDPDNIASAKTCENAGGEFVETTLIPEDNDMYAEGKRDVTIYRFTLL
ncbi:MAG: GNAT family N-acetyltransferase [Clostridia bacterium]|nr:GNAT family N-acetyltransferase [Clostridia bacterium]